MVPELPYPECGETKQNCWESSVRSRLNLQHRAFYIRMGRLVSPFVNMVICWAWSKEKYPEGGGFRMGNTCIPVADSF